MRTVLADDFSASEAAGAAMECEPMLMEEETSHLRMVRRRGMGMGFVSKSLSMNEVKVGAEFP